MEEESNKEDGRLGSYEFMKDLIFIKSRVFGIWKERLVVLSKREKGGELMYGKFSYYDKELIESSPDSLPKKSLVGTTKINESCYVDISNVEKDRPLSFDFVTPKRIYSLDFECEETHKIWKEAITGIIHEVIETKIAKQCEDILEGRQKTNTQSNESVSIFPDQVAGHKKKGLSMLADLTGETVYKPNRHQEEEFYELLKQKSEEDPNFPSHFFPQYNGKSTVHTQVDNILRTQLQENRYSVVKEYIQLSNLLKGYRKPCILDIKCGANSRGTDDSAGIIKGIKQEIMSIITTSGSLGFRIAGMKVYNKEEDKFIRRSPYYGTILTQETIIKSIIFFVSDGDTVRYNVLQQIMEKMKDMIEWFQKQKEFIFLSSSLLLYYDAFADDSADIRIIDFAHGIVFPESGPDIDRFFLFGLTNLYFILERIVVNKETLKSNIPTTHKSNQLF